MSGIENCDVVLFLFPTLLSALDRYRAGFGVLEFTGQNNRDIGVLWERVHTENVRFLTLLKMLFEPIGGGNGIVLNRDRTKMPNSRVDALLEKTLSDAYPVLVELMSSIAVCVNELVRRVEKVRLQVA